MLFFLSSALNNALYNGFRREKILLLLCPTRQYNYLKLLAPDLVGHIAHKDLLQPEQV